MGRPVTKANGRIKPLTVLGANGKEEYHPEARYKLSWYESGKKRFEDVGQDTDVAVASLQRKETALASFNLSAFTVPLLRACLPSEFSVPSKSARPAIPEDGSTNPEAALR